MLLAQVVKDSYVVLMLRPMKRWPKLVAALPGLLNNAGTHDLKASTRYRNGPCIEARSAI